MQPSDKSGEEPNPSCQSQSSVIDNSDYKNISEVHGSDETDSKIESLPKATYTFDDSSQKKLTGKEKLLTWINKQMKIEMTDGRVLFGVFLCTDRDGNVILGSCSEYLTEACGFFDEPRMLGLVMVPGRHIVSIHHAPNNLEGETA